MRRAPFTIPWLLLFLQSMLYAQQPAALPGTAHSQLTIYNDNFAVVRTTLPLDLHQGRNTVSTTSVTRQVEPDSVVLRDPSGRTAFQVVEQNYDAAVVSQEYLLHKFEGKEVDFCCETQPSGKSQLIHGRILRAPEPATPYTGYNQGQALIEIEGHMQFWLPGQPSFPVSTDGLLLKPTLRWEIDSHGNAHMDAELAYVTRDMQWDATYNGVLDGSASAMDEGPGSLNGWVKLENRSGTDFPDAAIKLMAGDVAKLRQTGRENGMTVLRSMSQPVNVSTTEKPFDDFYLYDLHRRVTLLDGETKQVQFLDIPDFTIRRTYRYDGSSSNVPFQPQVGQFVTDIRYGLGDNRKVAIEEEFANTKANHLGMPFPAGRLRLYRRDTDGQLEFTGEAMIPHTPVDQPVDIAAGNAFDLTGTRTQTSFHVDTSGRSIDESFRIHLTNAKAGSTVVEVVEHMRRGENWQITAHSNDYKQPDASTITFPVVTPSQGKRI